MRATPQGRQSRYREILRLMLEDMERAQPLFKPTNFWQCGLPRILGDLEALGFDGFRAHRSAHRFFVPLYGKRWLVRRAALRRLADARSAAIPGPLRVLLDHFAGRGRARCDYQVFLAADRDAPPNLRSLSESRVGAPVEQFTFDGRRYSRSSLNYLRGLALLKKSDDLSSLASTLEIGGGFGSLGEILVQADASQIYVDVDIPPVAAVATYYLSELFGADAVLAYDESRTMTAIDPGRLPGGRRIAVLCPWQLPHLEGGIDLFVNYISFQEMEPHVVANYLALVKPLTRRWALLRNSRHGKRVADRAGALGVDRPVTTDMLVEGFGEFDLVARDAAVFGEVSPDGAFESEVLCFKRGLRPPS